MRNLLYLLTFFLITPLTIAISLFALNILSRNQSKNYEASAAVPTLNAFSAPKYGSRVYASLPDPIGKVAGFASTMDARAEILKQYLDSYSSPLTPYAQELVDTSEKYGIDFRLLVAIAQQESNLCKKIPADSFNCWGWGIHSRGTLKFANFTEGIETVARGLKEEYLDKGYSTPEEIMGKYTPSSPGTWASGVRQFLEEME